VVGLLLHGSDDGFIMYHQDTGGRVTPGDITTVGMVTL